MDTHKISNLHVHVVCHVPKNDFPVVVVVVALLTGFIFADLSFTHEMPIDHFARKGNEPDSHIYTYTRTHSHAPTQSSHIRQLSLTKIIHRPPARPKEKSNQICYEK